MKIIPPLPGGIGYNYRATDIFCCLQEILRISCNDQRRSWFFFQIMKVSLSCIFEKHYYILIIMRTVVNFFYLFVLAWKCFVPYAFCIVDINIRAEITWWTVCYFHLSFESRISYYHYVKSHILWCFKNKQFSQLVVVFNI